MGFGDVLGNLCWRCFKGNPSTKRNQGTISTGASHLKTHHGVVLRLSTLLGVGFKGKQEEATFFVDGKGSNFDTPPHTHPHTHTHPHPHPRVTIKTCHLRGIPKPRGLHNQTAGRLHLLTAGLNLYLSECGSNARDPLVPNQEEQNKTCTRVCVNVQTANVLRLRSCSGLLTVCQWVTDLPFAPWFKFPPPPPQQTCIPPPTTIQARVATTPSLLPFSWPNSTVRKKWTWLLLAIPDQRQGIGGCFQTNRFMIMGQHF